MRNLTEHAQRACDRWVSPGGLMRCCEATIRQTTKLTELGDLLQCAHCDSWMVVNHRGFWEWMADDDEEHSNG